MTFQEWLAIREGLWLNDDKVLEGLSKLPQPKPKKQSHRKPLTQAVRPAQPQVRPVLPKFSIAPKKKRTTVMVARIECQLFSSDQAVASCCFSRRRRRAAPIPETQAPIPNKAREEGSGTVEVVK